MSELLHLLGDLVWFATIAVGLALSVTGRARLGRGAAPAVAGFAVLLAVAVVDVVWEPRSVAPASAGTFDVLAAMEPGALIAMLALYAAYPAGLALLVVAVLRARTER